MMRTPLLDLAIVAQGDVCDVIAGVHPLQQHNRPCYTPLLIEGARYTLRSHQGQAVHFTKVACRSRKVFQAISFALQVSMSLCIYKERERCEEMI